MQIGTELKLAPFPNTNRRDVFGVRRHVAAFKARTCPRTPKQCTTYSSPGFAALPEGDGPQGRGYSRFYLADPISSIPLRTADATATSADAEATA